MIGEYVIGGNRYRLQELGLNACLKRRGLEQKEDTVSKMFKAGYSSEEIPESWLRTYCIRDVEACEELFIEQRKELREKNLEAVNYQRNLVTPCLADIEAQGMQLDKEKVDELTEMVEQDYARTTAELQDFCEGANPGSPKQLAPFIYENLGFKVPRDYKGNLALTASGNPSVAAEVLDRLKPTTSRQREFIRRFQEWKKLHGDVTKYLRKFRECCRENSGLLYGSFNQCSTRTHRLSSSGLEYRVQFQNLNRSFKPLFTSRNLGWSIGEADGAQLEFRVAGFLGSDAVVLKDVVDGADIHSFTASILGVTRQDAKAHTFKPLYGGFSGSPKEREYYQAFAERYKGVAETQRGWTYHVLQKQSLLTRSGLVYYWPGTKKLASGYITNTTSIYNYPVQGFATAEIIPIALVCAWHRMKDWQSFLINTVHDSLIAELHPDEVEAWHELAQQCLIRDCYDLLDRLYAVRFTIPLGAGVTVSSHWGDKAAKESEVVYEAPRELWEEAAQEAGMI